MPSSRRYNNATNAIIKERKCTTQGCHSKAMVTYKAVTNTTLLQRQQLHLGAKEQSRLSQNKSTTIEASTESNCLQMLDTKIFAESIELL